MLHHDQLATRIARRIGASATSTFHMVRLREPADLDETVRGWLADTDPPATLHRPAPWGPVSVTGTPVLLTPAERAQYEAEWSEFREMDPAKLAEVVASPRIVDGRNSLDPAAWRAAGWTYRALGRP